MVVHIFHYENLQLVSNKDGNPYFQIIDPSVPLISSWTI